MLPQNNPDRMTSYPELFPEDFGERLEKLVEFVGLSWEEFVDRLGVENDRVTEWRAGTIPTGGGYGTSCGWRCRPPGVRGDASGERLTRRGRGVGGMTRARLRRGYTNDGRRVRPCGYGAASFPPPPLEASEGAEPCRHTWDEPETVSFSYDSRDIIRVCETCQQAHTANSQRQTQNKAVYMVALGEAIADAATTSSQYLAV